MEPLLDGEASAGEHRTTRARWWILGVYCLLAICQSCTWNVFGPIFPATYLAFPTWTPTFLNWVINTANIAFGLMLYPQAEGVKRYGARRPTIFCAVQILALSLIHI